MSFAIFYVVQPPRYSAFSVPLLASIRQYFPADVKVFGYCPEENLKDIPADVIRFHREMSAEIRPIQTQGRWAEPYPHGNKILAALDDRGTDHALFVDTDVVFAHPIDWRDFADNPNVTCSPATTITWGGDSEWKLIYDHLGLDMPDLRIKLLRRRAKHSFLPYFNAGMIGFRDKPLAGNKRFAEIWYETALAIDQLTALPKRRPYLDQMSLPPAMTKAGLTWRRLDDVDQYILGGRIRGKPLPDTPIKAIHYRHPAFLQEIGALEQALAPLRNLPASLIGATLTLFSSFLAGNPSDLQDEVIAEA